jgi:hypothetical protein
VSEVKLADDPQLSIWTARCGENVIERVIGVMEARAGSGPRPLLSVDVSDEVVTL